ncbi:MAG: hypothetical protein F6K35_07890 [Okeania sp. SIO2H7]|nr:hypothetical protein [Okeania sp. SIO2H7]
MIFDKIRELIYPDPKILINIEQLNEGNAQVVLEENDPGATLKKVTLKNFDNSNTVAFKLDVPGKRISNYLNPSAEKINKACDGIIFTQIEKRYYVFFCELKSGKPNEQECIVKYRNSALFVGYILDIIKEFYHIKVEFHRKYLLFDIKKKANKTPTKLRKTQPDILTDSEDGTEIPVYKIHHLTTFFNIRHLQL